MKTSFKENLKILITICSVLIAVAITPLIQLSHRVTILEERMLNRKNDIKSIYELINKDIKSIHELINKTEKHLHENDKDIYNTIGQLRERVAKLEK